MTRFQMLHLHGEAAERSPVSPLLQVVLLPLHQAVDDGAAVAVPALQGVVAHTRIGQLQMG